MKVLTITSPGYTHEVHMLNVGDVLEGFGGSKHPLEAGRDFQTGARQKKPTASMVVRSTSAMGPHDVEYDIDDPSIWNWIAQSINAVDGAVTATAGE